MDRQREVNALYVSLLGRLPEPDAASNCERFLSSGGTLDGLRDMIYVSDEYKRRVASLAFAQRGRDRAAAAGPAFRTDNPLSQLPELYQDELLPYFTHRGAYRPLAVTIETINICNNDCIICPYSSQTRKKQMMSLELFAKAIADYAAIGGGSLGLTPMTGELFLDKHLPERLEMLAAQPTIGPLSAITNGSTVHRFNDRELVGLIEPFERIAISIYGLDADEYLAMTRKPTYERMLDGAARLLKLGGTKRVSIGLRQLKRRPAEEVKGWVEQLADRAGVPAGEIRHAATLSYVNWAFFDISRPLPHDAGWVPLVVNKTQCALPLVSAQILSDGTVTFCGCMDFDAHSSLVLGNIADKTLRELMSGDKVRTLMNWADNGVPDFCKTCTAHRPIDLLIAHRESLGRALEIFGG
jgi:hypothetical protein